MMSVNRYTSRLHTLYGNRLFHSSRILQKKHYNYDLDSLVEWKKETTQVFGSVRKPTKTGKLKKLQKGLCPQVEENLQILNALSVNRQNSWEAVSNVTIKKANKAMKTCEADTAIPDDIFLTYLSTSNTVKGHGQEKRFTEHVESCTEACSLDIPEDVFLSSVAPYIDEPVLQNSIDGKECDVDLYSDNASIVIPKISPIPISSSGTSDQKLRKSLSQVDVGVGESTVAERNVCKQAVNNSSTTVDTLNSEDLIPTIYHNDKQLATRSKNSKNNNVTKKASSKTYLQEDISSAIISDTNIDKKFEKEFTKNDIFIPKFKPIPLGTISSTSSNSSTLQPEISSLPLSQSTVANATLKLPFEPPESFQIITKIPFFPKESHIWQSQIDSQLFDSFKTDVEQMSLRVFPSVKSILNKTTSDLNRFFLNRWREGLIKELGEEGFRQHQEATIRNGVNLHANIMEHLSGKSADEIQVMPDNEGHWNSLQSALGAISDARGLEVEISHNILLYRGVFDCLARYKDLLCMIDWKSSKKPRPLLKNTYDDPVQIAAYIGALNSNDVYLKKYGQVNHGLIVVAYPDGSPAHIHLMNRSVCEQYWQDWTARLYTYYQLIYTEKMATNADKFNIQKQMLRSLGAAQ